MESPESLLIRRLERERMQAVKECERAHKGWHDANKEISELRERLEVSDALLADAYPILLAYGVQNSGNMTRVMMMDAIKLHLEFSDSAREVKP